MSGSPHHFLDGAGARLLAALVLVLALGALGYLNRSLLFGAGEIGDPAVAACLEERLGHVAMLEGDGLVTSEQAAGFRQRAITFCETMIGGQAGR